ncbi:MAG: ATP-binding cassette domain-containing protein [Rhodopseudomonas sp.]|nr:ATP-binding cassette domain-containing protein [Rhodopseudomonas sp.]
MTQPNNAQSENAPTSARAPWRLAILLAVAAAASGILLTGISAWFLGAVALAGLGPAALSFNFHMPAAFVRLFALTKTLGKYGERVVGHRAALLDQVKRRAALLAAMAQAPSTRAAGWQLGHQDRLSDYIDDVEDVDYARLRVAIPALVLIAGTGVLTVVTAWLTPLALLPIVVAVGAVLLTLRLSMRDLAARGATARSTQRNGGRLLGAALASAVPLKAGDDWSTALGTAFVQFERAESERLAQRKTFAVLDMLAGLAGPLAAIGVLVAAWHTGERGTGLLIAAFLAFAWLALAEAAQGMSRIVVGHIREKAARDGLSTWTATPAHDAEPTGSPLALQTLMLTQVPHQSPDGRKLGEPLTLALHAGKATVLTGASGTGKTTLLKQIAGWIVDEHHGRYTGNGVVLLGPCRRAASHLCLHDAAILSDTVRENLFAPEASDAQCWDALAAVEMQERIATAGGLDAWISQDTLSLGEAQRLNLARAWLSTAPLLLLDEPTEHLDGAQASRILARLLSQMADRIVIYSSHHADAADDTARIALGA